MYCTVADLILRYNSDGTIDELCYHEPTPNDFINQAVASAGNEVNAALMSRYVLPLLTVPPLLNDIACTIAFGLMHEWRRIGDKDAPHYIAMQNARSMLKRIEKGDYELDAPVLIEDEASETSEISIEGSGRMFSRNSLKDL